MCDQWTGSNHYAPLTHFKIFSVLVSALVDPAYLYVRIMQNGVVMHMAGLIVGIRNPMYVTKFRFGKKITQRPAVGPPPSLHHLSFIQTPRLHDKSRNVVAAVRTSTE